MARHIDADRLRAEIEKLDAQNTSDLWDGADDDQCYGYDLALDHIKRLIDSLQQEQPMEFDANRLLEILSDRVKLFRGWSSETVSPIRIDECEQIIDIIKQLIPAQDKYSLEKRKQECVYRTLSDNGGYECERYAGAFSPCDGRCSWVVDYPKLKEMEEKEQSKINLEKEIHKKVLELHTAPCYDELASFARHFYELGLKAKEEGK